MLNRCRRLANELTNSLHRRRQMRSRMQFHVYLKISQFSLTNFYRIFFIHKQHCVCVSRKKTAKFGKLHFRQARTNLDNFGSAASVGLHFRSCHRNWHVILWGQLPQSTITAEILRHIDFQDGECQPCWICFDGNGGPSTKLFCGQSSVLKSLSIVPDILRSI